MSWLDLGLNRLGFQTLWSALFASCSKWATFWQVDGG